MTEILTKAGRHGPPDALAAMGLSCSINSLAILISITIIVTLLTVML